MYRLFSGGRKILRNKRAIELSINFIVMLIIGIALFGFGIQFLAKFFSGTQKMKAQLDTQTQARIESLLDQGSRVAIPLNSKTIEIGKSDIFGLGILNVLSSKDSDTFYVTAGCEDEKITLLYTKVYEIKNNEKKVIDILAEPKAGTQTGKTNICNVCVARNTPLEGCSESPYYGCCSNTADKSKLYDGVIHKMYIKVP